MKVAYSSLAGIKMQIYLVGGAVRNRLLGLPVAERDWVVVGASPEEMLSRGFRQVGKDFPVFLHPETQEEYALARTERKTGHGYGGFHVHASPEVTLEEDLKRRDLTINAMAQDEQGHIIDPFGGQADVERGVLRHVSAAFSEDPLRILRIARFAAQFADRGFHIAPETMTLLHEMVQSGEVEHLVAERVWQELQKGFSRQNPSVFFQTLRECNALSVLLPEIDALFGVPNPEKSHPEIDSGLHTLLVIDQAARLSSDPKVVFAALLHDVGKGLTPKEQWPKHPNHERNGVQIVKAICERLRVPSTFRELACLVCEYHLDCHRALELEVPELLTLLNRLDVWRRYDRFCEFLTACEADARGCQGFEHRDYPQAAYLQKIYQVATEVDVKVLLAKGLEGKAFAEALQKARLEKIQETLYKRNQ
ncbi:MAG: multifunctional protein [Gammaproteobacteria bacterium]|jgi:tRNA nucleotidyltransferase (CCA-adding enzyme)|nr:multifunctional protein [Gammaproteobacteria bacterium]